MKKSVRIQIYLIVALRKGLYLPHTREALKRFGNGSSKYASKNTSAHDLNPVFQDEGTFEWDKESIARGSF